MIKKIQYKQKQNTNMQKKKAKKKTQYKTKDGFATYSDT